MHIPHTSSKSAQKQPPPHCFYWACLGPVLFGSVLGQLLLCLEVSSGEIAPWQQFRITSRLTLTFAPWSSSRLRGSEVEWNLSTDKCIFFHASLKTPTCRTNIVFDKHCFSVFQVRFILWWPCFLARSVSETVRKDLLQRFQRSPLYKKLQKDWPRERWTHYMPVGTPSKGGTVGAELGSHRWKRLSIALSCCAQKRQCQEKKKSR